MYKYIIKAVVFAASGFIKLAESNVSLMCIGAFEEIELPEELKHSKFPK